MFFIQEGARSPSSKPPGRRGFCSDEPAVWNATQKSCVGFWVARDYVTSALSLSESRVWTLNTTPGARCVRVKSMEGVVFTCLRSSVRCGVESPLPSCSLRLRFASLRFAPHPFRSLPSPSHLSLTLLTRKQRGRPQVARCARACVDQQTAAPGRAGWRGAAVVCAR